MGQSIEFHFQEGFAGETVTVRSDGATLVNETMRTRLQTGLAHIATVELAAGKTAIVAVPDKNLESKHAIVDTDRWIAVNLVDRSLKVRSVPDRPGYV